MVCKLILGPRKCWYGNDIYSSVSSTRMDE